MQGVGYSPRPERKSPPTYKKTELKVVLESEEEGTSSESSTPRGQQGSDTPRGVFSPGQQQGSGTPRGVFSP